MNSVRSNNLIFRYHMLTQSGCKYIGIGNFGFVKETHFLYHEYNSIFIHMFNVWIYQDIYKFRVCIYQDIYMFRVWIYQDIYMFRIWIYQDIYIFRVWVYQDIYQGMGILGIFTFRVWVY